MDFAVVIVVVIIWLVGFIRVIIVIIIFIVIIVIADIVVIVIIFRVFWFIWVFGLIEVVVIIVVLVPVPLLVSLDLVIIVVLLIVVFFLIVVFWVLRIFWVLRVFRVFGVFGIIGVLGVLGIIGVRVRVRVLVLLGRLSGLLDLIVVIVVVIVTWLVGFIGLIGFIGVVIVVPVRLHLGVAVVVVHSIFSLLVGHGAISLVEDRVGHHLDFAFLDVLLGFLMDTDVVLVAVHVFRLGSIAFLDHVLLGTLLRVLSLLRLVHLFLVLDRLAHIRTRLGFLRANLVLDEGGVARALVRGARRGDSAFMAGVLGGSCHIADHCQSQNQIFPHYSIIFII